MSKKSTHIERDFLLLCGFDLSFGYSREDVKAYQSTHAVLWEKFSAINRGEFDDVLCDSDEKELGFLIVCGADIEYGYWDSDVKTYQDAMPELWANWSAYCEQSDGDLFSVIPWTVKPVSTDWSALCCYSEKIMRRE